MLEESQKQWKIFFLLKRKAKMEYTKSYYNIKKNNK